MTDRELLEKAAKAAGIEGEHRTEHMCVDGDWMDVTAIFLADGMGWWNPLEDDGDALRLAVDLGLLVAAGRSWTGFYGEQIAAGVEAAEAHRRAFVRAAAEMADAAGADAKFTGPRVG